MQKIQLSIPEPCHESWQQMTPTEQGRFCNACAKEVIDFSTMSDLQVLNYFTNITHEKVCGRALPEQLDKVISRPEPPKKRLFWYWNYFVMLLMFFGKGNSVKAQGDAKPVTEINTAGSMGIKGEMNGVDGIKNYASRIIEGKVTDKESNPVSFASVKVSGKPVGVFADANGTYSLRVNSNAVLIISGAGFKPVAITVGSQNIIYTVIEKSELYNEKLLNVMVGGISFNNMDDYTAPISTKSIALIKVKEIETNKVIPNASLLIISASYFDSVVTNKKGEHKMKGIKNYEEYFVRVVADGYEPNDFTIDGSDFSNRKKDWEVFLRRKKITNSEVTKADTNQNGAEKLPLAIKRSNSMAKLGTETRVVLGQVSSNIFSGKPLYVVDGAIMPSTNDINPDDIEDISVLQGPEASALFGPKAANGAIVVTTKKLKVKNLDTVTVTSTSSRVVGRLLSTTTFSTTVMGATVKGVSVKASVADTLKIFTTKITGAIKIYPNPVQRGQQFSMVLKLREAGLYKIQVANATGQIVLQKQINANAKEITEKIMSDSRWSAGIYYVSIINSKNQITGKTSFVCR